MKRTYLRDAVLALAAVELLPHRLRPALLRKAGLRIGKGTFLLPGLRIAGDGQISLGENVFINRGCYFDAVSTISIADGVRVADHVKLITSTHHLGSEEQRAGEGTSAPVSIEEGVWVGAGAMVLPGVTIAAGCVIAAGAVVARTTLPNRLYGGVPARELKAL